MPRLACRVCLLLCLIGVFSSLSTTPWLSLGLCFGIILWYRVATPFEWATKIMVGAVAVGYTAISLASNRGPFRLVSSYLSLDDENGHIRLAAKEAIFKLMREYWPLGWGFSDDWPRPDWYIWTSVDSFYLCILLNAGVFAMSVFLGVVLVTLLSLMPVVARDSAAAPLKGWMLALLCIATGGIAVAIFGNMIFFLYFFLGVAQFAVERRPSQNRRARLPAHSCLSSVRVRLAGA